MSDLDSTKRLTLLLNLNPGLSDADRYAIDMLKRWYHNAKQSHSVAADLEASVTRFHRDIYLSGLFLHLLDRTLPSHLADALTETQISTSTLLQFLEACGKTSSASFSDEQLDQFRTLLHEQQPPTSAATVPTTDPQILTLLQQIIAMQQAQIASMAQLQQQGLHVAARRGPASNEQESGVLSEANVADKIEQVQKIKKKGIF
jgi:hypothetical protein